MELLETKLKDAFLLKPRVFGDERGYFMESYNKRTFNKLSGLEVQFVQDNESMSGYGTLRGFHFQKPPFAQAKLVRVIKGEVQDVIIDLRPSSLTYGHSQSFILSEENKHQLFVPRGFGHAFLTLSRYAVFCYKVDNWYSPESDSGIIWNDKTIDVEWRVPKRDVLLSEKDAALQDFNKYDIKPDFK